jgi:hypothetical protein
MGRDDRADTLKAAVAMIGVVAAAAGCAAKTGAAPDDAGAGVDLGDEVGEGDFDAAPDWAPPVCPAAGGEIQNAACTDETAAGPCVDQIQVDDSAPGPAGGTLVTGTYDLVERTAYTSPGGATGPIGAPRQETIVLTGSGLDFTISGAALSAGTLARQTVAATLSSAQFRLQIISTCPPPAAGADGGAGTPPVYYYYTAADATLTLYRIAPVGPVEANSYLRR